MPCTGPTPPDRRLLYNIASLFLHHNKDYFFCHKTFNDILDDIYPNTIWRDYRKTDMFDSYYKQCHIAMALGIKDVDTLTDLLYNADQHLGFLTF